jgi:hypothetical protein
LYDVRYREVFSYLVLYFGNKTIGHAEVRGVGPVGKTAPYLFGRALLFLFQIAVTSAYSVCVCVRERERERERSVVSAFIENVHF